MSRWRTPARETARSSPGTARGGQHLRDEREQVRGAGEPLRLPGHQVLGAADEEVRRGIGLLAELHHEGAFQTKRRCGHIRDLALPLHGALATPEGAPPSGKNSQIFVKNSPRDPRALPLNGNMAAG